MGKAKIVVNEHFVVRKDDDRATTEVIYDPPLLAESQNIRVELRKEKNHNRPHVHIIKKGKYKTFDVSIALNDLEILAGKENIGVFGEDEYQVIIEFIIDNQDRLKKIYENLRGDL